MNFRACRALLCLLLITCAGCTGGGSGIGLALIYKAKQETAVVLLYFDEVLMMNGRIGPMYLGPSGFAHVALTTPRGTDWPPNEITALWRYEAIDPADEASNRVQPEWREARATVPLRAQMTAEDLKRMRKAPKRHRFELTLLFDRDRLAVQTKVQPRE